MKKIVVVVFAFLLENSFGMMPLQNPADQSTNKNVKRKFSWQEDQRLQELHEQFGDLWSSIAQYMPDRTPRQCRERWVNYLDPNLNRSPWTSDEDTLLLSLFQQYGGKWATISKKFPDRSVANIKNRCNVLLRRQHKEYIQPSNSKALPSDYVANKADVSIRTSNSKALPTHVPAGPTIPTHPIVSAPVVNNPSQIALLKPQDLLAGIDIWSMDASNYSAFDDPELMDLTDTPKQTYPETVYYLGTVSLDRPIREENSSRNRVVTPKISPVAHETPLARASEHKTFLEQVIEETEKELNECIYPEEEIIRQEWRDKAEYLKKYRPEEWEEWKRVFGDFSKW